MVAAHPAGSSRLYPCATLNLPSTAGRHSLTGIHPLVHGILQGSGSSRIPEEGVNLKAHAGGWSV